MMLGRQEMAPRPDAARDPDAVIHAGLSVPANRPFVHPDPGRPIFRHSAEP